MLSKLCNLILIMMQLVFLSCTEYVPILPSSVPIPPSSVPILPSSKPSLSGQSLYVSNCSACHSVNPAVGAFGPPIKGSSLELLTTKINFGKYPAGYKPKRDTALMPKFALKAEEIAAIWQFLNEE